MTSGSDQQTARVNVAGEMWREFRILAIESDRSIADYLGQLVRDELRRARRRKRRSEEQAAPPSDAPDGGAPGSEKPRRSVRLAEAKLLTELPRPDASWRRSLQPP